MSDSIEYILDKRAEKDASIREALALYPDLRFDGPYLCANSLKSEECDTIMCIDANDGSVLRAGRIVGSVVVFREWMHGRRVSGLLGDLESHHKALYQGLLRVLAGSR